MPRIAAALASWFPRLALAAFVAGIWLELDHQAFSHLRIPVPFIYEGAGVGFREAFREIMVPLAAFGALVGLATGLWSTSRLLPLALSASMVTLYAVYMAFVWLAGSDPNYAFGNLDDENAPEDFLAKGGVVYGVVVGIGLAGLWAGTGVAQFYRDILALRRRPPGSDGTTRVNARD